MVTQGLSDILKFRPDTIETIPLDQLRTYERNPRTHSDEQIARLAAAIAEFGWTMPVMVNDDGIVIAGHGRLKAAQSLGINSIPAIRIKHLSETQIKALRIADNKIAEDAGWDNDILSMEFHDLNSDGYDLGLTGFSDADISALMAPLHNDGLTDPDDVPDVEEGAVSVLGDLWICGNHRVICANCYDVSSYSAVCLRSVDLIVTSPPYNQSINKFKPSGMFNDNDGGRRWVTKVSSLAYVDDLPEKEYQDQQRLLLEILLKIVVDNGSIFYNHKNRYRDKRTISPLCWLPGPFNLRQEIVWRRPGSITQNARMFLPCDERIYWMYKGDDFKFHDTTDIKSYSTVWDISPKANLDHAVAFPTEIPYRCIMACSDDGRIVLDPFSGSGTTMIACEMLSRSFSGIEISPQYVDVSVRRWQEFTGQKAILEGDGRTFDEIAAERVVAG